MNAFFEMVRDIASGLIFAAVIVVCTPFGWIGMYIIYLLFGRG